MKHCYVHSRVSNMSHCNLYCLHWQNLCSAATREWKPLRSSVRSKMQDWTHSQADYPAKSTVSLFRINTASYERSCADHPLTLSTIPSNSTDATAMAVTAQHPDRFILPDLVSHCIFPLRCHPSADDIENASADWLDVGCPELSTKKRAALHRLKAGILTAHCYPDCDVEHLRVTSDFLIYLFHLDNISDGMMSKRSEELADVVMNAHWFPDAYMPTKHPGKEQPEKESSAGKLARE